MILVDPKDRSGNHYINERALTFSENDLEDPQRIAVSLVSGTVIMVNKKDDGDGVSIPRAANGDYEKWALKGYSTKIPEGRNAAHYIFARLSRSERTALIVFSLNNYNIDGSVSTFTTNEDGSVTESRSEASSDYYYIRIGYLSETDGSSDRVLTYDCGQLSVGYEIDDIRGAWNELFVPHYDDPVNPKKLTWIEAKSHMGVNGGVTMFVDNGSVDLPSLYEGLPVDGDTLYWEEDEEGNKVLKAKTPEETTTTLGSLTNVGEWADGAATADRIMVQKKGSSQWVSLSLEELGTASFENVKESGEGNAYTSIVLSEDKKTLTLNKGENFAKQADYEALNTKVTDFLEGEDTDTIINKWKELETFLGGMSESDELATILSGKADKGTTLKDYGITDAYTKTDIDSALDDYVTIKGKEEITGEKNFTGGLKVNGSPIVYDKDNEYWKLDGDLLVTGAVTMFANEGKYTPSTIMDAVSVDGTTIMNDGTKLYINPNLDLGGGGLEDVNVTGTGNAVTSASLVGNVLTLTKGASFLTSHQAIYNLTMEEGKFSPLTFDPNGAAQTVNIPTKTSHLTNDSSFITSSYVDGKFVTIAGNEDVTGIHNFTKGLKIGGIKVSSSQDGVIYLEGNLVVSGGVTMFGTDSVTASTVMDGVNVDGTTIIKSGNKLMLNPDLELGGGGINSLKVKLGSVEYNGVGTTDVVVSLPAYPSVPTSLKNPNKLTVTLADGETKVDYDGSLQKSFALTRLYKASEVTTATYDEGTITPLAMNQWTIGKFPLKDGTGASGTWGISISGNLYNNSTGDKLGLGTSQPYFYDASANSGAGKNYNLLHRGLLSTSAFGDSYLDTMVQYTINATSLSTSNYYPIIFSGTPKMMRVSMYSQTGSSSAAYNCNSLDFSFRGQGWTDVPNGLTVHHYSNYTASEKTIGCIGMGQEAGEKVVWVRGGLTYYISSNVTPTLKTANYTSGGQIYTVGTNEYGGTNTKVTIYWTPQSTSSRGTMYHSGGLALGGSLGVAGNISVTGTSTFTGLATFNGNLTAPASTVNNSVSGSYQFRNSYGASLSSAGWYRFATSTTANNAGGTYIFFIRRSYTIINNEAYIISCIVDHGKVHWNLLNGHANTRLITQVRCTYTNDSTIYFDLYYNGTVGNTVYVNAVGDCTLQVPTATSSALTSTSTFDLGDGMIIDGNLLVKGGITMYATSSTSPITEFYASYLKVTGNMDIVGNVNSTYYMLNNKVTNPYLKLIHTYNEANYTHYLQGYQGYLYLGAGSTNSIRISSDGSLYTPKTLTQGSDIRYKDVHKDLSLSLSTIAEAPSFEFNFKDDEQKSTHIGTSAQYWQSVEGVVTEDSEGRLGMDYSSLGVVMGISLAKELSRFESDTDRRIRLLEEENKRLKEEVEQLKTA